MNEVSTQKIEVQVWLRQPFSSAETQIANTRKVVSNLDQTPVDFLQKVGAMN